VEKAKGIYIVYDLENDRFFSYYHDLIDYVLILVLDDFYQIGFYRNRLKSWLFDSPQQFLMARMSKKKS
jgi:hypothetical protein